MRREVALFVFMAGLLSASPISLQLTSGARIDGELITKRGGDYIVDAGYKILEVPGSFVASAKDAEDSQTPANLASDPRLLINLSKNGPTLTSEGLVDRANESVVLVKTPTGLGSGFIINPNGYILTNQHVISGEDEISVTLFSRDGKNLKKTETKDVAIVAISGKLDLALLKIDPPFELKALPFAYPASTGAGEAVWAVGSPLGLERSASSGIVSLPARLIDDQLYVQTTALINPGNSGGPLMNRRGEVVGVNNMKIVSPGTEGLAFAIPVETVEFFLRNRDAFAYDASNSNNGFHYLKPPAP